MAKVLRLNSVRFRIGRFLILISWISHTISVTNEITHSVVKKTIIPRAEPVILLPLVQNELKLTQTPPPAARSRSNPGFSPLLARSLHRAFDVRRIFHQPVGQVQAQQRYCGTLMKKIQRQLKLSVIHPPSVGPMAGAHTTAVNP